MKPYRIRNYTGDSGEFVVWDIEAVNWFDVRCVVALHSNGDWIAAKSVRALFGAAIERGWCTKRTSWFAHYGGRYDHLVALPELLRDWTMHRGIYHSGFGLWTFDLRQNEHTIQFRDSSRLLPGSVEAIGKSIGLPKIEVDRAHIEKLAWGKLIEYCRRDCEVVRKALLQLWPILPVEGDTLASRVTRHLRATAVPPDAWGWDADTDRKSALGYYGGRVEVFRTGLAPGASFDINSAYPFAMTKPLPTEFLGERKRWPNSAEGIVCATVTVPECLYPVLPYRPKDGLWRDVTMFPTGRIKGAWAAPELRRAMECGATVERVHWFHHYKLAPWMREFMSGRYVLRAKAKRAGDAFQAYAQKILLNSCSGKVIEREEHEQWFTHDPDWAGVDPDELDERHIETRDGTAHVLRVLRSKQSGAFRHAAVAAYVTALTRVQLHKAIVATDAAYCDTDCVHCAPDRAPDDVGKGLGQWDSEGEYVSAEFIAPKLYAVDHGGEDFRVKAKGFGRPKCDLREFWQRLKSRSEIVREDTLSFVSQVRTRVKEKRVGDKTVPVGLLSPRRVKLTRRFNGAAPKRCFDADGSSRPWTMEQLKTQRPELILPSPRRAGRK